MKISVSLPMEDVELVDQFVADNRGPSRSAVIHEAISLLRNATLEDAYTAAAAEWKSTPDAELWNTTTVDGLSDASR